MKQRWVLTGLALVTLATIGGLSILKPDPEPSHSEASGTSVSPAQESHAYAAVAGRSTDATGNRIEAGSAQSQTSKQPESPRAPPDPEANTEILNEPLSLPANLRQSLTQVADVYRAQNRYPSFSQPIGSELEALRYQLISRSKSVFLFRLATVLRLMPV